MLHPQIDDPPQSIAKQFTVGVAEIEAHAESGITHAEGDWIRLESDTKYPDGRPLMIENYRWQIYYPPVVLRRLLLDINDLALTTAQRIEAALPREPEQPQVPSESERRSAEAASFVTNNQYFWDNQSVTVAVGNNPLAATVFNEQKVILAERLTDFLRENGVEIDNLGEVIEEATVEDVDEPDSGVGRWMGRVKAASVQGGRLIVEESLKTAISQVITGQFDPSIFMRLFG
jgi:hypothetical protein